MRIYTDQIRYQDKYVVLRTDKAIHVRWWCGSNTWSNDEPITVRGYANYDGDSKLDDEISFLEMIINAIIYNYEANGNYKAQRPDPYGTKPEKIAVMREWIQEHMGTLPTKKDINAEWGLNL